MRVENFNAQMEKIIASFNGVEKIKLLLHSCCAPCSSACIERLREHFDLTVYFYNPNMDSVEEYNKRADEQSRLCESLKVKCIIEEYLPQEFLDVAKGKEDAIEGGARCKECFTLRLTKSANKAKELGFDYFATTLTVSPLKNAKILNELGNLIADNIGVKFLPSDFKKKGGYQRSIELSREYNLYRQNYCGCVFSKNIIPNG